MNAVFDIVEQLIGDEDCNIKAPRSTAWIVDFDWLTIFGIFRLPYNIINPAQPTHDINISIN